MNKDIDMWIERIQNTMEFQKFECLEFVNMRMTRADLVSLSVLLNSLKDFANTNGEEL